MYVRTYMYLGQKYILYIDNNFFNIQESCNLVSISVRAACCLAINRHVTVICAGCGVQYYIVDVTCVTASFPNAFNPQSSAQQLQQQANTPAGKQTEGKSGHHRQRVSRTGK